MFTVENDKKQHRNLIMHWIEPVSRLFPLDHIENESKTEQDLKQ
jgi:hypothetical protein